MAVLQLSELVHLIPTIELKKLFVERFQHRAWRGTIVSVIIDLKRDLPLNQIYREMPLPEGITHEDKLFER